MMEHIDELHLTNLLQEEWLLPLLGASLSFDDLRNLSLSSKLMNAAVQSLVQSWPNEISELLRTWCGKTPSPALFITGVHVAFKESEAFSDALANGNIKYRHPAPIIRFQVATLAYDSETKRLLGRPWTEVPVHGTQQLTLGRMHPVVCKANDSGTQIFYCSGRCVVSSGRRWISARKIVDRDVNTAAIFNTDTGMWTQMPSMPDFRHKCGIFRIGSRIYLIGGERWTWGFRQTTKSCLCFDLEQEQWDVPGFENFPGEAHAQFAVVVLNNSRVIVAGGSSAVRVDGQDEPSREVFSLDINTGTWTQLEDLPESVCLSSNPKGFFLKSKNHPAGTVVVTCEEAWARLLPSGEWEVTPDLNGLGLKAILLDPKQNKIFSWNQWLELPPHYDESDPFIFKSAVHVGDMVLDWDDRTPVVSI